MSRVVIGMDPHKRSATIEAINEREKVLARGQMSAPEVPPVPNRLAGRFRRA